MGRFRLIAGPNGSGKSTLVDQIATHANLGLLLNADVLQRQLAQTPLIDLNAYSIHAEQDEWVSFSDDHGLRINTDCLKDSRIENDLLSLKHSPDSYGAAIVTDFLRSKLLQTNQTFSMETVFSHPSKLSCITEAVQAGYRTYLYFVATESPDISIERIRQRIEAGGHHVPLEKIGSRYFRALDQLLPGMMLAYRSFIFDNSESMRLIAETSPDLKLTIKNDTIPDWFDHYVLSRFSIGNKCGRVPQNP